VRRDRRDLHRGQERQWHLKIELPIRFSLWDLSFRLWHLRGAFTGEYFIKIHAVLAIYYGVASLDLITQMSLYAFPW